jgi:omega-6 fatty acid desaturase (delta-12 desaturase)
VFQQADRFRFTVPEPSPRLRSAVARFAAPVAVKTALQLGTSIGLFLAGCAAMYWVYSLSYLLTLALAVPTGALLVRVFIVQHDCGHGALFASRRANHAVGMLCSLFTLTPYTNWRRHHAAHHANWNNLDRRQSGSDLYSSCLTVQEYQALTPWHRLVYRISHHPLVANVLLPPLIFLLLYRIPFDTPREWRHERYTVYATDLSIAAMIVAAGLLLGFRQVLLVQLPVVAEASIIGVWLFSLQHRFESSLWARQGDWNAAAAALQGSSYLRLPKVLQWCTGNIGFHHVHHLDPRVPNYRLEECSEAVPALGSVPPMSLGAGLRALWLALWDEEHRRLVSFADLRRRHVKPGSAYGIEGMPR